MKFIFRLRFTLLFVARAVHHEPFTSFHYPMRTKATFDDIQSYSVLDFQSTKPSLNSKRRKRVGNLQHARHLESFR